ncbi:hypothetical protein B0H11DRAFT_2257702 [Mycena galericulata]|nr:hypothetical protein B0H11DRAFT_2257702 [Mycena galericulata]
MDSGPSHSPRLTKRATFDNCHNFTVQGGIFNVAADRNEDQGDFRTIRLGDLNLLHEISKQNIVDSYQVIRRKRTGAVIRRVPAVSGRRTIYQARIYGSSEEVTAVVYEGSDFEKASFLGFVPQRTLEYRKYIQHRSHAEWREGVRHPSLVQLLGVTSSSRVKALVYNDGLISVNEFRKMHAKSPLVSAYLEYEIGRNFQAAIDHWDDTTNQRLLLSGPGGLSQRLETGTMMWIRMSTRQLCLEVNKNQDEDTLALQLPTYIVDTASFGVQLTPDPNLDEKLLARMDLDDIHHILCSFYQWHYLTTSDPGMVLLGAVAWPTSNFLIISVHLRFSISYEPDEFTLQGTFMADTPTNEVYLFLFPATIEGSNDQRVIYLPPQRETYYWSFDPMGIEQLSDDTVMELGLPRVHFQAILHGAHWSSEHYEVIRDFHRAKGFDPHRQDAAIKLGYPLLDVHKLNNCLAGGRVTDDLELLEDWMNINCTIS